MFCRLYVVCHKRQLLCSVIKSFIILGDHCSKLGRLVRLEWINWLRSKFFMTGGLLKTHACSVIQSLRLAYTPSLVPRAGAEILRSCNVTGPRPRCKSLSVIIKHMRRGCQ